MGPICEDPRVLTDRLFEIITDSYSGDPFFNGKVYQDTLYGARVLLGQADVCRQLGPRIKEPSVLLRLLTFCHSDLYLHQDGIHLHSVLRQTPDER